jgi:hypothetical protein
MLATIFWVFISKICIRNHIHNQTPFNTYEYAKKKIDPICGTEFCKLIKQFNVPHNHFNLFWTSNAIFFTNNFIETIFFCEAMKLGW